MRIFATIAFFALVLAAVGLHGVLAYAVAQRDREFAIRVAIGARRRHLVGMLAHDAAVMVLAGTGVGAFLGFMATPMLGEFLESGTTTNAVVLVAVEILIMAVAALAALGP